MNERISTSRRAVLAGIVSAPAFAGTALALSGPDPIFAAIENHRKVDAYFMKLARSEDELRESSVEPVPDTPEMLAAGDATVNARQLLAETVPTTPTGLSAYLDYLLTCSVELNIFFFDGRDEPMDFLKSLHRAVHGMTGLQPMQSPLLAAPLLAVTDASADAELLALSPALELTIRDYAALQAADDWEAVDPDLERWSELHDRMHPLVDRIMSHRPKTLAGLGMFMRAASLSYDDYERANDGDENRHGDLISAVCTFCGIQPVVTDREDEETDDEGVS